MEVGSNWQYDYPYSLFDASEMKKKKNDVCTNTAWCKNQQRHPREARKRGPTLYQ